MRRLIGLINRLPLWLRAPFVVGNYGLARLISPRPSEFLGVRIFRFLPDPDDDVVEEAEAKLRRALSLIKEHDPRWLPHIRGKVRRLLIMPGAMGPEFRPLVRGCYIPISNIEEGSEEILALVLVHEATHARVHEWMRASSFRERPEIQERLERTCVRREVALASKLPKDGDRLAKWALDRLETRWWEPQRREEDRRKFLDEYYGQE